MVNKITKARLKNFIWYNSAKILILTVILSVVLGLLFNFVEKKPTDGQDFKILIDESITLGVEIDELFSDLFTSDEDGGGFSYEILKGETIIARNSNENPKDYVENFAKAGSDLITFHLEACKNEKEILRYFSVNFELSSIL